MDRKSLLSRLSSLATVDPVYLSVSDYDLDEAMDDILGDTDSTNSICESEVDNTINSVFDIDPYYT